MSAPELEAAFPELFKIARQMRARDPGNPQAVRLHSVRMGEIDPQTGQGGERVELVADKPSGCQPLPGGGFVCSR